jgi:hypothetical protein
LVGSWLSLLPPPSPTFHKSSLPILSITSMPPKPAVRTWGTRFDTLPSSPPPSPQTRETALLQDPNAADGTGSNIDASNTKKVEKMPHNASVFVGRCHISLFYFLSDADLRIACLRTSSSRSYPACSPNICLSTPKSRA